MDILPQKALVILRKYVTAIASVALEIKRLVAVEIIFVKFAMIHIDLRIKSGVLGVRRSYTHIVVKLLE